MDLIVCVVCFVNWFVEEFDGINEFVVIFIYVDFLIVFSYLVFRLSGFMDGFMRLDLVKFSYVEIED